jgi:transposase InsO family protein
LDIEHDPAGDFRKDFESFMLDQLGKRDPGSDEARAEQVRAHHTFAHAGARPLYHQLWTAGWFWPSMREDARREAARCGRCLAFATHKTGFHPLRPVLARLPFDHVAIDLTGPLPTSPGGKNFVFVMVDLATRFVILRPLASKSSLEVARCFLSVAADFGLPRVVQSDNGSEWVNRVFKQLVAVTGFDHRLVAAYHPQGNGAAESAVKRAKALLKRRLVAALSEWEVMLPSVQLALNSATPRRTGSSPFALLFGRGANFFEDFRSDEVGDISEEELLDRSRALFEIVLPAVARRSAEHAAGYARSSDRRRRVRVDTLPPGTSVMLRKGALEDGKLSPAWEGPLKVIKRNRGGAYLLSGPDGAQIPGKFSLNRLAQIEAALGDDSEEFVVQKIVSHRGEGSDVEYLTRWEGFSSADDTWEPPESFANGPAIRAYWRTKKAL